jgi:hypothetical protein
VVVDPDGHLCSSQHHVSGSCCLCGDALSRSSGSGSECHEADAGTDQCSCVCPGIRSHVRSRDCTSVVSRVRSRDGSNGTTRFAHPLHSLECPLPNPVRDLEIEYNLDVMLIVCYWILQLTLRRLVPWVLLSHTVRPLRRWFRDRAQCNPALAGTWRQVLEFCSWDLPLFFSADELRHVQLGVCRMCVL